MDRNEIEYRPIKSMVFDDSFIADYLIVLNEAFNSSYTKDFFVKKYFKNIYGPSILVIAYYKNTPVGADALWRNDINGKVAYQSADTCVREGYRGLGIFRRLVEYKMSLIEPDAIVYGFPNANSYPGFKKMGWNLTDEYRTCLYNGTNDFKKEHEVKIDSEYARYWFMGKKGYKILHQKGKDFLVAKRSWLPIYLIIGEIDTEVSSSFDTLKGISILLYKARKVNWYNKKQVPTRVIAFNTDIKVPVWKMDAI